MLRPALAAIGLLTVHASQAEPLHVPSQYPTIQAAIDASQTDDEIHIAPGVYRELLNPENKSVTLIGAGAGETILSGDLDGDTVADGVILDYQNEGSDVLPLIRIQGLTLTNATSAIRFYRAGRLDIQSSTLLLCSDLSINMPYSQNEPLLFELNIADSRFEGPGGGITLYGSPEIDIRHCTFENLTQPALYAQPASAALHDSAFIRCAGGVYLLYAGPISITNCLFESNTTAPGNFLNATALHIKSPEPTTISNTRFLSNGSFSSPPAVRIESGSQPIPLIGCEFDANKGSFDSAVSLNGTAYFEDCSFTNNIGRSVGPINISESRFLPSRIDRCSFIGNGAVQPNGDYWPAGGGGFCIERGNVIVRDSLFRNNIADSAGGAYIAGHAHIDRCRFEGNRAKSEAGAVRIGSNSSSAITNSAFVGNTAQSGDGGVIWSRAELLVAGNVFVGNTAKHGTVAFLRARQNLNQPVIPVGFVANVVAPSDSQSAPFDSYFGTFDVSTESNLITTDLPSIRFTRPPSDGGDGFGDDPRTPDIDESLNDDFGDLRLLPGSPAIDAGGNAKLPRDVYDLDRDGDTTELLVGTADLAGNPRFVDDPNAPNLYDLAGQAGPIDLGPYEFQPALLVAPPCAADTNNDGVLTPADFTAWIAAFNAGAPECDQNADETCTPADFTAWIANFNAGC